jgi:hypothetical protein
LAAAGSGDLARCPAVRGAGAGADRRGRRDMIVVLVIIAIIIALVAMVAT